MLQVGERPLVFVGLAPAKNVNLLSMHTDLLVTVDETLITGVHRCVQPASALPLAFSLTR